MPRAIHAIIAAAIATPLAALAQGEPEPEAVENCGYYAVVGAARSRETALALQARLGAQGAGILDHDQVDGFRSGFFSVVFGPFADEEAAADQVDSWRQAVPDAYAKLGCPGEVAVAQAQPLDAPGPEAGPEPEATAPATAPDDAAAPVAAAGPIELPLPEGVYVKQGVSCQQPPQTAFRIYDGSGIGSHTTRACRLTFEESDGETFRGENSCENVVYGLRTDTRLSVQILGPESFRLVEFGAVEGDFRLCPDLAPEDFAAD